MSLWFRHHRPHAQRASNVSPASSQASRQFLHRTSSAIAQNGTTCSDSNQSSGTIPSQALLPAALARVAGTVSVCIQCAANGARKRQRARPGELPLIYLLRCWRAGGKAQGLA